MTNWEVDEAVYEALGRTLENSGNRDLHPVLRLAVNRAVHVAVYRAVNRAGGLAVRDAVYVAMDQAVGWVWHQAFRAAQGTPHPRLKLYLEGVP